jgi:LysR family transcriptional regulator of gallate degradation
MNARQLSHFLAALELGSLQRAAAKMHLSQPAMSKSIARLEEEYGTALFSRTPRGIEPTAFARELERHARRVLADIERSHGVARRMRAGKHGTVAVGAGPAFIPAINEIVGGMIAEGYDGGFTVLQDYNDNLRRRLQLNEIDLYVAMITGREHPEDFHTELLFTDRIVCACRAGHPLLAGELTDERLLSFNWIAHEDGEIGRLMIEGYFTSRQLARPNIQVVTNTDKTLRHFARASDMICIVPEVALAQPGYEGMALIDSRALTFTRKVGLVTRDAPAFSLVVEEFIRRLRATLQAPS